MYRKAIRILLALALVGMPYVAYGDTVVRIEYSEINVERMQQLNQAEQLQLQSDKGKVNQNLANDAYKDLQDTVKDLQKQIDDIEEVMPLLSIAYSQTQVEINELQANLDSDIADGTLDPSVPADEAVIELRQGEIGGKQMQAGGYIQQIMILSMTQVALKEVVENLQDPLIALEHRVIQAERGHQQVEMNRGVELQKLTIEAQNLFQEYYKIDEERRVIQEAQTVTAELIALTRSRAQRGLVDALVVKRLELDQERERIELMEKEHQQWQTEQRLKMQLGIALDQQVQFGAKQDIQPVALADLEEVTTILALEDDSPFWQSYQGKLSQQQLTWNLEDLEFYQKKKDKNASEYKLAVIEQKELSIQRDQAYKQWQAQMREVHRQLTTAYNQHTVSNTGLDIKQRQLEQIKLRKELGMATDYDVLLVAKELRASDLAQIQAEHAYEMQRVELEKLLIKTTHK